MENASKALIMAGSIMLALLIISLSIVTFRNFSASANPDFTEAEVGDFNSKILPYCGEHVAGSQVNALIQYVRALNVSNYKEGKPYVVIKFPNGKHLDKEGNFESDATKKVDTGKFYKVQVTDYSNTGTISLVTISE